jgi:anti-sigma B factor antagonist
VSAVHSEDVRDREETAFACVVEPDHDVVTVKAVGEVDLATAPILETAIADVRDSGFVHIVVDLHEVDFLSCAGVHVLLTQDEALLACGGTLRVIAAPDVVDRIFDLAEVRGRLSFDPVVVGASERRGDIA